MKTLFKLIITLLIISLFSVSNAYSKGKPKERKEKKTEVKLTPTLKATASSTQIPDGIVSGVQQRFNGGIFCWTCSYCVCFVVLDGWALDPFGDGFDYHIRDVVPVVDPKTGDQYNVDKTRPAQ